MNEIESRILISLREVAGERPDFVYEPVFIEERGDSLCAYVKNGVPSCLVGHALARSGVDISPLEGTVRNIENISHVIRTLVPDISEGTVEILQGIQERQDDYESWGEIVEDMLGWTY